MHLVSTSEWVSACTFEKQDMKQQQQHGDDDEHNGREDDDDEFRSPIIPSRQELLHEEGVLLAMAQRHYI